MPNDSAGKGCERAQAFFIVTGELELIFSDAEYESAAGGTCFRWRSAGRGGRASV